MKLAEALAALPGLEVAVLTSTKGAQTDPSSPVAVFPSVKTWGFREIPSILRILKKWRPDVIHIQFPTQEYGNAPMPKFLPAILGLAGFRIVQTWHEVRQQVTLGAPLWLLSQLLASGALVFVRPRYKTMLAPSLRLALSRKTSRFIPNASALTQVNLAPEEAVQVQGRFGGPERSMVVYFGFIYAAKGVELLFDVADPDLHHIVIVGDPLRDVPQDYYQEVVRRANSAPWAGKATLTGFLPAEEVARIIAAAGAVILPFSEGGGEWNTSIHGAQVQGVFVITTSTERHGYDDETNTYYARPGDAADMRAALKQYFGVRNGNNIKSKIPTWESISAAHVDVYRGLM